MIMMVVIELQNHRVVGLQGTLRIISFQPHCHYIRLINTPCNLALNTYRENREIPVFLGRW